MTSDTDLITRSGNQCELCTATDTLSSYSVEPRDTEAAWLCKTCQTQIDGVMVPGHWQALSGTMWSPVPAVQVLIWRALSKLSSQSWAQDLLDMLYLDQDTLEWAKAGYVSPDADAAPTRDSHGTILQAGDTVTLIKDLPVKGAGFTAKRGTAVRGISLTDNPEHIEGRVNGQRIVLVAAYLKNQARLC